MTQISSVFMSGAAIFLLNEYLQYLIQILDSLFVFFRNYNESNSI